MFISRIATVAAFIGLAAMPAAWAADPSAFVVAKSNGSGKPMVFQSTAALKKGAVMTVHVFNAQPAMLLQVAMCDRDCPNMHVVRSVQLYFEGMESINQKVVLPQDGRVALWVQRATQQTQLPLASVGGTLWTQNFVDPFASYVAPAIVPGASPVMAASRYRLEQNGLHASFDHNSFVTISLPDVSG
jgi:hypothetical protein